MGTRPPTARRSGVLLHLTSLPSEEGVGTLGEEAHRFVEFVASAGQSCWQILPVYPTIVGDSPFQGPSVFAGNPNLVSLRALVEVGDLRPDEYDQFVARWREHRASTPGCGDSCVDYGFLWEHKLGFDSRRAGFDRAPLRLAYQGFEERADDRRKEGFRAFCRDNVRWLDDYARFTSLKDAYGFDIVWCQWQPDDRFRHTGFEEEIDPDLAEFFKYVQFVFDEQMRSLRSSAHSRAVELIGDMAFYPAYDSADVWASRELFQLDREGRPTRVAAIPPDYFSEEGQLWGNPLYRWGEAGTEEDHAAVYRWWSRRMARELTYFDRVRVDHFRGFDSYGSVPAGATTAADATWMRGPGREPFDLMARELGVRPPVIAEDLGVVTDEVRTLLKTLGLPGMKVFLFADWATGDPRADTVHPYLPHNVADDAHTVYYTGTHDNETLREKIELVMSGIERRNLEAYVAGSTEAGLEWKIIDAVSNSAAELVIFPVQDLLYLGREARMNNPSQASGWWRWRLSEDQMSRLSGEVSRRLLALTARNGRSGQ